MTRIFTIVSLGFGIEHEYFNQVFPAHTTPFGRQAGGNRLRFLKNGGDHFATFLKVTDDATGEIIGPAKWNIYKDGTAPDERGLGTEEYWGTQEEARYADALFRGYLVPRREKIQESRGNVVGELTSYILSWFFYAALFLKLQTTFANECNLFCGCAALDLLAVDPKAQYRGAGRMLVEWGTKAADELDYEVNPLFFLLSFT